jgi:hypothetical protein
MLAQKMWDDKYLSNSDFAYIYPFFDSDQINLLEMKYLELLQYNTHIKSSIYAKIYLELKSIAIEDYPMKPMDNFTMQRLENQSLNFEKKTKKKLKTNPDFNKDEEGHFSQVVIN